MEKLIYLVIAVALIFAALGAKIASPSSTPKTSTQTTTKSTIDSNTPIFSPQSANSDFEEQLTPPEPPTQSDENSAQLPGLPY